MSKHLARREEKHLLHQNQAQEGGNVYLEDEITKCKMNCLYYI